MRALVYDRFTEAPRLRDVPEPACPPDGCVVEVRATGLCRSDWHAWQGHDPDVRLPHVGGHEFAGVVREVGPLVQTVSVGQRVTVPFVCACGQCATCRAGAAQVCEDQYQPGFSGWGSFAELVAVPRADFNVVALPDELDFVTAAGLGCRFATAYRAVRAHGRVAPSEWVAVFGCGGVGLAATMIAAATGGRVIAVDVAPGALELARRFGAVATVDPGSEDPVAAVRRLTGGGAHVAIDALGSAATCVASVSCLRPRGRQVQVGLLVGDDARAAVPLDRVIAYELQLHGSHGMAAADYPAMLAEIAAGRLDPAAMVIGRIGLDELGPALVAMSSSSPTGLLVAVP